MEKLFNFRPDGKIISTDKGDLKLMVIRKGPRGIIGMVRRNGPVIIWDRNEAEAHENDTEEQLTNKVIEVINSK
jgi:hypothetical protein